MADAVESFDAVPVNRHFGFRLTESSRTAAQVEAEIQPWFAQEGEVVHGGILSTLADTTAVYCLFPFLEPSETMTSIEFKVNFLSGARMDRGTLSAKGRLLRRGSRVAVVSVDVGQGDRLVAIGLFTYLIGEQERR